MQHPRKRRKNPRDFGKGSLLQVAEQPSVSSGVLSLYLVYEIIEHLLMIKICVTLNEDQSQYNEHVMHYHV